MGYMAHHAIVVTADTGQLAPLHALARRVFDETPAFVTECTPVAVNGYSSFMVAPDGSKEGWDDSDAGDAARGEFVKALELARHYSVDWVEVRFGGDDGDTQTYVARHGDDDQTFARLGASREG